MTYQELANLVEGMTEEQKECDVSIYSPDKGEFFEIGRKILFTSDDNDDPANGILDEEHPYLLLME